MKFDFTQIMASNSNEEIVRIVTVDRNKYQQDAILAAELELSKRGLNSEYIGAIKIKYEAEEKIQKEKSLLIPGMGIRIANVVIDILMIIIIMPIVGYVLPIQNNEDGGLLSFLSTILISFSGIFYYVIMEYKFNRTIGKMITGTKVIGKDGGRPSLQDVIIRTLLRLIPFEAFSFLFSNRGIHDRLSNTEVVRNT